MLLAIHIAAGGLAIVLGAAALSVKKGGGIHRRSGLLFVGAMLVMGFTAWMLGLRKSAIVPRDTLTCTRKPGAGAVHAAILVGDIVRSRMAQKDALPWSRYSLARLSSWALSATITVLADMRTAAIAGGSTRPCGARTPAASGIAMML